MASVVDASTAAAKAAVESERRSDGASTLAGALKKLEKLMEVFVADHAFLGDDAKKLEIQVAIVMQATRETLDRIRACGTTALSGRYTKYLKESKLLTDDDKEFLKGARQI